jgi:hypothetical protein
MEGHLAWILGIHSHDPWTTLCVGNIELGNTNLVIQGMTNNRMAPGVEQKWCC